MLSVFVFRILVNHALEEKVVQSGKFASKKKKKKKRDLSLINSGDVVFTTHDIQQTPLHIANDQLANTYTECEYYVHVAQRLNVGWPHRRVG